MTWRANFAPSDTGYASISMPHGTAPSSPEDGDVWTTTAGLFARINGSTVGPFGTSGGGISDGDKGDITVSGSGATWTIDNNVVTFAKMQDISTEKLIGKHTAGSGDPEQVGLDGGLEFFGANIRRSALTGAITAPSGSNTTSLGSFTISQLNTAVSDADVATTADLAGYQPLDIQLTSVAALGYTGNALKVVRVNAGETDFELATPSGGGGLTAPQIASLISIRF